MPNVRIPFVFNCKNNKWIVNLAAKRVVEIVNKKN